MAKQINEYTKTRTVSNISVFDLLDFDSTDDNGVTYESAKCSILNMLDYFHSTLPTLYGGDGTLVVGVGSYRNITASTIETRTIGGNVSVKMANDVTDYGFLIRDNANNEKARFGFDQSLNSSILELHDSAGVFLTAKDGFLGINTSSQVGGLGQSLSFNVDGKVYTSDTAQFRNIYLTYGGALSKIVSLAGDSMEIGTMSNSDKSSFVRGSVFEMSSTPTGVSFGSSAPATERWQFRGDGNLTKMQFISGNTVGASSDTAIFQLDIVNKYYDGFTDNNEVKTEFIGKVISQTGVSQLSIAQNGVLVMSLKDSGVISAPNLPTTAAGLIAGDIWNDSGVLKIV